MAKADLQITQQLFKRLHQYGREPSMGEDVGFLAGVEGPDDLTLLSMVIPVEDNTDKLVNCFAESLVYLPSGINVCGLFIRMSEPCDIKAVEVYCAKHFPRHLQVLFDDEEWVVLFATGPGEEPTVYWYDLVEGRATETSFEQCEDNILNKYILMRLKASVPMGFNVENNKDALGPSIEQELNYVHGQLNSDSMVFSINDSDVLLYAEDPENYEWNVIGSGSACKDLYECIKSENTDFSKHSKLRKTGDYSQDLIELEGMCQISGERAACRTLGCAPIIQHSHQEYKYAKLHLPFDVAIYVRPIETVHKIPKMLVKGINRQLEGILRCFKKYSKPDGIYRPIPYHFVPPQLNHLITVVSPDGLEEEELEYERKRLHSLFVLPFNRPLLRRLNAHRFPGDVQGGYLLNTHEGLNCSGAKPHQLHLVQGTYSYHHYMQDRFDDNQWGCAYRSLQTLISWFRFQGYTDKCIPDHRQIQQILVDVGDKDAKFVGSKKWIGSTEVSYVLDSHLGVTSKILFVNSGADLAHKGRELSTHFDTQGTPIMIGGGVLAHTILGVHFNDKSGEVRFLILDPHYTGGEDIKVIQDKGWCGWKGSSFWDKSSYYNLCMPQRPPMI